MTCQDVNTGFCFVFVFEFNANSENIITFIPCLAVISCFLVCLVKIGLLHPGLISFLDDCFLSLCESFHVYSC